MVFDANTTNTLIVALINLNMILAAGCGKKKTVNYLIFSGRGEEDIDDFIFRPLK